MSNDCKNIEHLPTQTEIAPGPPLPPCDIVTVRPIPDELREPTGELQPEEGPLTPEPIRIYNHAQTVYCEAPGTEGDEVTIEEGVFFERFYFSTILSLTENVLTYIAKNKLEPHIEDGVHSGKLEPRDLRRMTGMTLAQANELLEAIRIIQDRQNAYARLAAQAQQICLYWNTPQSAECVDEDMAHNGDHPDAVFRYEVPAHKYSSVHSQELADEQARNEAETAVNCFYTNDEVTVDCQTNPGRPEEHMDPVPNDTTPLYPGRSLRVGRVTIPAGTHTSASSKEDANARAREEGYLLLNCWYPNKAVHVECEDPEARSFKVKPSDEPPRHADPEKRERGQIVDIPVGFFTSEVSEEMATTEAEILAQALLECCFVNDPFSYSCDPQIVVQADGTKEERYADPEKGRTEVVVEEGQFTSCNSKQEANDIARQMSEGLLECIFCNKRVMPVCVPQWVTDGILAGAIELPLTDGATYNGNTLKLATLPPEATVGAPENEYCTNDAQQSQLVADAAGGARASNMGMDCIYRNDLLYACCAGVNPITGEEMKPNTLHSLVHPETGEPYLFYTMYPSYACIAHDYSYPNSANDYVVVPVGMFSAGGEDKKDWVNEAAIDFARTMLYCVWANPKTYGTCNTEDYAIDLCDDKWYVGKDAPGDADQLVEWSNTFDRPVVLPRGYLRYVGSGDDEGEAFATLWSTAQYFAKTMIVCIYTNLLQVSGCERAEQGPPRVEVRTEGRWTTYKYIQDGAVGTIDPYTVYASSPREANAIAAELAAAIAACDINTVLVWSIDGRSWEAFPGWDYEGPTWYPDPSYVPPLFTSSPSSTSSPKPTPPSPPEGKGCCYPECPYFKGGGNAQNTRAISLMSDEFTGQQAIMTAVMTGIKRLDLRANAIMENVDKLLAKYNG